MSSSCLRCYPETNRNFHCAAFIINSTLKEMISRRVLDLSAAFLFQIFRRLFLMDVRGDKILLTQRRRIILEANCCVTKGLWYLKSVPFTSCPSSSPSPRHPAALNAPHVKLWLLFSLHCCWSPACPVKTQTEPPAQTRVQLKDCDSVTIKHRGTIL